MDENTLNSISTKITIEYWMELSADERDFFMFRSLQTIQGDIGSLKKRRLVRDPLYAFFGGFAGAVTFMGASIKLRLWGS